MPSQKNHAQSIPAWPTKDGPWQTDTFTVYFNPLRGKGVNWLHFAIQF